VNERYAGKAQGVLGPEAVKCHDLGYESVDDISAQLLVVAHRGTQLKGQATDPLANGYLGQHMIDQMRSRVVHAPARARRADRAAFAGKSHQVLEAALAALHPGIAVLEKTASQIAFDLALDEIGQTAGLLRALEEGRPMPDEHAVKRRVLGLTLVSVGGERLRTYSSMGSSGHPRAWCMNRTRHPPKSFRLLARSKWPNRRQPPGGRQEPGEGVHGRAQRQAV